MRLLLSGAYGLFLLLTVQMPVTAQRLFWKNINTDQGLPGNEVYDILQDHHGYMWFATNHGMARFNGYTFWQPTDTSSFSGLESFTPTEDASGRIWFTRLDGSLWYIENDTIRAWEHNAVTAPFRKKYMLVEDMAIEANGTIWLAFCNLGFLLVRNNGQCSIMPEGNSNYLVFSEIGGKLIHSISLAEARRNLSITHTPHYFTALHLKGQQTTTLSPQLGCKRRHYAERGAWKLQNNDIVIAHNGNLSLAHNGELHWQYAADIFPRKLVESPRGEILIAVPYHKNVGLFLASSIEQVRRGDYQNLLPGYFVTDVHCDHEGGWWAATLYDGVFYCKNPDLQLFDQSTGIPANEIRSITTDEDSIVFAGLRPTFITAINRITNASYSLPLPQIISHKIDALFFDTLNNRLWCGDPLFFYENKKWQQVLSSSGDAIGGSIKSISLDHTGALFWVSTAFGFCRVDIRTGKSLRLGKTTSGDNYTRTFSVLNDRKDNLWVITNEGLRIWRDGKFVEPPFSHPALRLQPRCLAMLPDGSLVIGLLAGGVLVRQPTGQVTHLTVRDGLSTDAVKKLVVSADGVILVCTNNGLNRLMRDDAGRWRIEVLGTTQGLPSNQINDAFTLAGETWVATNRGLVRLRKLPISAPMLAPVLEQMLVNNRPVEYAAGFKLAHYENNVVFRFFSLHFRSEGDIVYRYRLVGIDTGFVYPNVREVRFAHLSPDTYILEVQARNENGGWSAPARWPFTVCAAWWQTWWFKALLVLLGAGGLSLWYLYRLRRVQQEVQVRNKIRELETAALRAQINPHFIFNCLTSIQYFITENDSITANLYLARFARLVRLALHSSVDGLHTLAEEVEMLHNYLELENLRFQNRFVFRITVEPSLEPQEIFLTPLLVQPFVENALLHGMKNKLEGGIIAIDFKCEGEYLLVTVTDNGPGFAIESAEKSLSGRKSLGMMLTQRRLEMLARKSGEKAFILEKVQDSNGRVSGTRVLLRVPLASPKTTASH
jgi:ligand-binding sensor domain-containing protein